MTAHAKLSPSSANRWLICPGSVKASEGMPDVPGEPALVGTVAHALAERCLKEDLPARHFIGKTITIAEPSQPNGKFSRKVDDDLAGDVQTYLDLCAELRSKNYGIEVPTIHVERRVTVVEGEVFGTADYLVIDAFGDHLEVADYKNGSDPVEIEGNPQQMCYALGALNEAPHVKTVGTNVCQPNARDKSFAGVHRRRTMTADALRKWRDEVLLPGIEATKAPDAPRVAGDHCKYCPALALCPQPQRQLLAEARVVFDPVTRPVELPAPQNLRKEDLAKVLEAAPLLTKWLKAVDEHAFGLLMDGADVPGLKLVQGRRSYAYEDEAEAEKVLKKLLPRGKAYKQTLLTPAQARKAVKDDPEAAAAVEALIGETRGVSIAPADDKREAFNPHEKPSDVFDVAN